MIGHPPNLPSLTQPLGPLGPQLVKVRIHEASLVEQTREAPQLLHTDPGMSQMFNGTLIGYVNGGFNGI